MNRPKRALASPTRLTPLLALALIASPALTASAQDEEDGRPGDGQPLAKAHPLSLIHI